MTSGLKDLSTAWREHSLRSHRTTAGSREHPRPYSQNHPARTSSHCARHPAQRRSGREPGIGNPRCAGTRLNEQLSVKSHSPNCFPPRSLFLPTPPAPRNPTFPSSTAQYTTAAASSQCPPGSGPGTRSAVPAPEPGTGPRCARRRWPVAPARRPAPAAPAACSRGRSRRSGRGHTRASWR
ncbi:hypothetical protein F4780DRAFT_676442 [Xylariomycetidae sp. FL0641]|nr:hypothetical protein F4780DRAFT_676442 [Xylariomycetidae sp. FL0641]